MLISFLNNNGLPWTQNYFRKSLATFSISDRKYGDDRISDTEELNMDATREGGYFTYII